MAMTGESEVGWEVTTVDAMVELERVEVMAGQTAMTFVSSSVLFH